MKYNVNNTMSDKEKRLCIAQYCDNHECGKCVFAQRPEVKPWCETWGYEVIPSCYLDNILKEIFESYNIVEEETEPTTETVEYDTVNKPKHYCREGAMECIDEMVTLFGVEAVKHFCLCNAWKYRARAQYKGNAEEDMKKSDWYIRKYWELCDNG